MRSGDERAADSATLTMFLSVSSAAEATAVRATKATRMFTETDASSIKVSSLVLIPVRSR